ncbi:hypothetical protein MUP95_03165 [bacterium]|nr:hypothetical protein [bacterium]
MFEEILHYSYNIKKRFASLFVLMWSIFSLLLNGCSRENPTYWPVSGTIFQNITWEIPIADSLQILVKQDDHWILPEPPKDIPAETTLTTHRIPELKRYSKQLGRVDQEVVNNNLPLQVEFYRFEKGSVQFLGYMNSDTINPLIVYDPPLIIFPSIMGTLPFSHESEGKTRTWNLETKSFTEEYQNRIRLELKESGLLLVDSTEVIGLLCEMTLSSDRTVGFGEVDLIVPDAVMLQCKIVIIEGFGPVLEWGYRSRDVEFSDNEQNVNNEEGIDRELGIPEEREFYIEVTFHHRVI